ncbi:MAG: HpcH/HpaI aldolase family protein [bacterium]|jgi:4-hydroxy-2-oxoheptanedioate aldolase
MKKNRLREIMQAGGNVIGLFISTPDPSIVEVLGYAGFDFGIMDMEHGPNDTVVAENMMRAADVTGMTPVVRVTTNHPSLILRALDSGAMGVIIPQVNDYESALQAAKSARYAPAGIRGMALGTRATKYGVYGRDEYLKFAAEEPLVIVQAETKESMENLPEILKISLIDMIFIGPTDLSQSLGYPGKIDQPEVQAAVHSIVKTARAAGKFVGLFVRSVDEAKYWAEQGVQFLAVGGDKGYLFRAAKEAVTALAENK